MTHARIMSWIMSFRITVLKFLLSQILTSIICINCIIHGLSSRSYIRSSHTYRRAILRGHMGLPAVGSAPDVLTSSHSPLLASSPPPAPIGLKWSREANTTTMNCTAGERGIEKAWNGDGAKEPKNPRTLYSLLSLATCRKMSFWHDTKEPLYLPPFSFSRVLPSIPFFQLSSFIIFPFPFCPTEISSH